MTCAPLPGAGGLGAASCADTAPTAMALAMPMLASAVFKLRFMDLFLLMDACAACMRRVLFDELIIAQHCLQRMR
jgi:hypothetical protein